ncbi:MAG: hypothetical protein KDE35_11740 [Geminicoccaceae bacterium]|nr:hypothetical protein [Geminicoccaceae bacterium]
MQTFDSLDEDDTGTVFRDVIMLALAGFVALVILMLPHLNPPGENNTADADPPGNVIVELRWPDEMDSDIDLWVQAPGDVPVGYSNKGGVIFNLLRDDLGRRADATGMNYEVSYSRGIPPGEYTVNVHLYRNPSRTFPIPVTVVTSVKKDSRESARQILASKVELVREGEEETVFRFALDESGDLVPGSVHNLQRQIRSLKKS